MTKPITRHTFERIGTSIYCSAIVGGKCKIFCGQPREAECHAFDEHKSACNKCRNAAGSLTMCDEGIRLWMLGSQSHLSDDVEGDRQVPFESAGRGETIRSAAIRKNGVVYVCWAHSYNELKRMNLDFPEDGFRNCEQGFVTATGRYVDRVEGLAIAQAANQIVRKHHPLDELLSEDLRPLPEPTIELHEVEPQEQSAPTDDELQSILAYCETAREGSPVAATHNSIWLSRVVTALMEEKAAREKAEALLWIPGIVAGDAPLYLPDYASDLLRRHYKLKEQARDSEDQIADQSREIDELRAELATLKERVFELEGAITKTLDENGHLADGEICTLIDLKRVIPNWKG